MPDLRIVDEAYLARREELLKHPAFGDDDGVLDPFTAVLNNQALERYIETWKVHTERGKAWVAQQAQQDDGEDGEDG